MIMIEDRTLHAVSEMSERFQAELLAKYQPRRGAAGPICQTKEMYQRFFRIQALDFGECSHHAVIGATTALYGLMWDEIEAYGKSRGNYLYVRIPAEFAIQPELTTDIVMVKFYSRLLISAIDAPYDETGPIRD